MNLWYITTYTLGTLLENMTKPGMLYTMNLLAAYVPLKHLILNLQ